MEYFGGKLEGFNDFEEVVYLRIACSNEKHAEVVYSIRLRMMLSMIDSDIFLEGRFYRFSLKSGFIRFSITIDFKEEKQFFISLKSKNIIRFKIGLANFKLCEFPVFCFEGILGQRLR